MGVTFIFPASKHHLVLPRLGFMGVPSRGRDSGGRRGQEV